MANFFLSNFWAAYHWAKSFWKGTPAGGDVYATCTLTGIGSLHCLARDASLSVSAGDLSGSINFSYRAVSIETASFTVFVSCRLDATPRVEYSQVWQATGLLKMSLRHILEIYIDVDIVSTMAEGLRLFAIRTLETPDLALSSSFLSEEGDDDLISLLEGYALGREYISERA